MNQKTKIEKGYTPQIQPSKSDDNRTSGYTPPKNNDTVNNIAPPPRTK